MTVLVTTAHLTGAERGGGQHPHWSVPLIRTSTTSITFNAIASHHITTTTTIGHCCPIPLTVGSFVNSTSSSRPCHFSSGFTEPTPQT